MSAAKEEAELMVVEYKKQILISSFVSSGMTSVFIESQAKQCALMSVNKVLHALKYSMIEPTHAIVRYYEQVKQEIEKL